MKVTLMVEALAPQLSGIGRYTWELCKGLAGRDAIDQLRFRRNGEWIEDPAALLMGHSGVAAKPDRPEPDRKPPYGTRRLIKRYRHLRGWWRDREELRASLFHGPNYFLPREARSGIITVHDLSVFKFPEAHPAERIAHFKRDFASSMERATHIITDTETVRQEVLAYSGFDPARVTAVPLGVDPAYHPRSADACNAVLASYGLHWGGYGLCVSALEPRKRIGDLLAAWRAQPLGLRSRHPLVLLGPKGWLNDDLRRQMAKGQEEGWLVTPGFVDEAELPVFYAGARLFAYPSIYEGFGLPPLEAMASGVPVIISNRSCLPEVCGDAAAQVDPGDGAALRETVERGLIDDDWRDAARTRGLLRAQGFTWDRCVDETLAVYQMVEPGAQRPQSLPPGSRVRIRPLAT